MSIYIPANSEHIPPPMRSDIEAKDCFYCGNHLFNDEERSTGGVVFWMGDDGFLVLHQPCAEALAVNLIQDARSLNSETKAIAKMRHQPVIKNIGHWYMKK